MSERARLNVVTGAFGFTGRHIALRLLAEGERVRTLTNHPNPDDDIAGRVDSAPFNFDNPDGLRESLHGASVLYNTCWIRFPRGRLTFDVAIRNIETLVQAAKEAGVGRIVHISVSNPSLDSPLPYFRGKAVVERIIAESGLPYSIIRPTLIFGDKGLLLNNMAWLIRRSPLFPVPGDGEYRVQPVFAGDVADLALEMAEIEGSVTVDAAGPEVYTFNDLLSLLCGLTGGRCRLIHVNPELSLALSRLPGILLRDVLITREETRGLMDNLLVSVEPPKCPTLLSAWLERNVDWLGSKYMPELRRHYR